MRCSAWSEGEAQLDKDESISSGPEGGGGAACLARALRRSVAFQRYWVEGGTLYDVSYKYFFSCLFPRRGWDAMAGVDNINMRTDRGLEHFSTVSSPERVLTLTNQITVF